MKNIILSLVGAFSIATVAAQNTASLNQTGSQNSSKSTQTGTLQTVSVVQNGTSNVNNNQQTSRYAQEASITQTGLGNTANTLQNAFAGPYNIITVTQNGTGAGGNTALVNQSDYSTISSEATVQQNGQNLKSTIKQLYAYEDIAVTEQTGYENHATINQGNGSRSSQNSVATIQQFSVFGPQDATINQLGNTNSAQIFQNNNAGPNNVVLINQDGNNNSSLVDQSSIATVSTKGTVIQLGNNNEAFLYQKGSGSFTSGSIATVTQTGNFNYTNLTQYGGTSNIATIVQTGDQNTVKGLTGSSGMQVGSNNSLTITQTWFSSGQGQFAQVQQLGNGNTGIISQSY
ncbi:hypothetical protein [Spirosoma aerophilum]